MENLVRTCYGAALQTAQLLDLPFALLPHSSLNEKLGILDTVVVPETPIPYLQYLAIGNGGHQMVTGPNNIAVPMPVQHSPADAALYNQLPFVLRLPNADLTPAQMANYRLRKIVTYNNTQYVAYYLKTLNLNGTSGGLVVNSPTMMYNSVSNGTTTSSAFTPSLANLNPTPPQLTSGSVVSTNGNYISATALVPINLDANDIAEFLNVCNIIYGSTNPAIISELALCSGLDYSTSGTFNGATQTYMDAIAVQIMTFVSTFYAANFTSSGISLEMDIGAVEPLFSLS